MSQPQVVLSLPPGVAAHDNEQLKAAVKELIARHCTGPGVSVVVLPPRTT